MSRRAGAREARPLYRLAACASSNSPPKYHNRGTMSGSAAISSRIPSQVSWFQSEETQSMHLKSSFPPTKRGASVNTPFNTAREPDTRKSSAADVLASHCPPPAPCILQNALRPRIAFVPPALAANLPTCQPTGSLRDKNKTLN